MLYSYHINIQIAFITSKITILAVLLYLQFLLIRDIIKTWKVLHEDL
jgi:hypothetical protein